MRSKPAYRQGEQKITDWTTVEGIRTYFDGGSGLKTTPVGGQQKGGRNHIATLRCSGSARRLDTQKIVGFWFRCTCTKWPPNILG